MSKNLNFILKSVIIYIVLGFSFSTANEIAIKYVYWGNVLVVIGFMCIFDRLVRHDKQKNIKIFKHVNIVYLFLFISFVTVILYDLFHIF
ncbi:hypothetical protein [Clostridium sp. AWRP]|uniref:hypothetical protein n=1 Tax=Clostridium sp. AWRP TaxID=2212991 RepID=UPI000FD94910|nr:hypothetical protein [Clostridium sp. AWRP]AZV57424.1 hypothetical protein DMR38_12840 [Clostridium sp. AWRP]